VALTPPLYYADLASFRAAGAFPFGGPNFDQLAWALAAAMVQWGPTVVLNGVAVGTAGAGTINVPTTRIFLVPNPPLIISGLASSGMVGPLSAALGTVVGQAIAKTISSYGQYTGGVVGVGVGADVSKVTVANPAALYPLLLTQMNVSLGFGPATAMMAQGLATGIASLLLTATGAGTVVGSPSTAPASGASTSVMV